MRSKMQKYWCKIDSDYSERCSAFALQLHFNMMKIINEWEKLSFWKEAPFLAYIVVISLDKLLQTDTTSIKACFFFFVKYEMHQNNKNWAYMQNTIFRY